MDSETVFLGPKKKIPSMKPGFFSPKNVLLKIGSYVSLQCLSVTKYRSFRKLLINFEEMILKFDTFNVDIKTRNHDRSILKH